MSKVLVGYAGKYGCTEECARYLSEKLNGEVELRNLKEKKKIDPSSYDKIVIGGSLYAGRIQKEVRDFCLKNADVLNHGSLGLFICGTAEGEAADKELETAFPQDLYHKARAKAFFGGRITIDKLGFLEKKIVKAVAKVESDINTVSVERMDEFAAQMNEA